MNTVPPVIILAGDIACILLLTWKLFWWKVRGGRAGRPPVDAAVGGGFAKVERDPAPGRGGRGDAQVAIGDAAEIDKKGTGLLVVTLIAYCLAWTLESSGPMNIALLLAAVFGGGVGRSFRPA